MVRAEHCRDRVNRPRNRAGGFTIIELIAVIILLGILSVAAMSRLMGASAYAPSLAAQELIALARLAQQTALARQDATVALELSATASDWQYAVLVDDGATLATLRTETSPRRGAAVTVQNAGINTQLSTTTALRLEFDGLGNLSGADAGGALDATVGIGLLISGDDTAFQLCVSASGYAHRDGCA